MSTTTTAPTAASLRAEYASIMSGLRERLSSRERMAGEWVENIATHDYIVDADGMILDGYGHATDEAGVWLESSPEIMRDFIEEFEGEVTSTLSGEYVGTKLRTVYVGATPAHTVTLTVDTKDATITLTHDEFGVIAQSSFTDAVGIDTECRELFNIARSA